MDTAEGCWQAIETELRSRIDLDESAARTGAFRQARGVPNAAALLRRCLVYAVCRASLRQVCAWAAGLGVARLSNPALEKRLQGAGAWLGEIAGALLAARATLTPRWPGYQLRVVDGTAVSVPGADGTSWRLHLSFDLGTARIVEATLTDVRGGESLTRFAPPPPGTILMGDAGYAHPRPLRSALAAGGDVLVRMGWNAVRLLTPENQSFDLFGALRRSTGAFGDWDVVVDDHQADQPPLRLRLIAGHKPAPACEQARRRVRETAKRKGHTPDARSLEAADWVLLLTSLPAETFDAEAVLATYRLRWQVELAIKRWKSLLDLGKPPMHNARTATTWIYSLLIAALLIEDQAAVEATRFPPQQPQPAARRLTVEDLRSLGREPAGSPLRGRRLAA